MSNLLPPDKAAKQLERATCAYLTTVQSVREVVTRGGGKISKELAKDWRTAYAQLSAAQWELEEVLK